MAGAGDFEVAIDVGGPWLLHWMTFFRSIARTAAGLFSSDDLAPDGKRLAALVADDADGEKLPTHLTFLLNFFDELRRRAPGDALTRSRSDTPR